MTDVAAAINLVKLAMRIEPFGDSDRITGPAFLVQIGNCPKYCAVVFAVEIILSEDVCNLVPRSGCKQQTTQYSLFCFNRVRRNSQVFDCRQFGCGHSG